MPPEADRHPSRPGAREVKVGVLLLAAVVALAVGIFLLGERQNLFESTNRYFIRFQDVSGLNAGNPVQLAGVNVGSVAEVVLPEDIEHRYLTVWVQVSERYAERIRSDSTARIKTLGLLGDKYIEISSGSPEFPRIPPRGEISTAPATDVDQLLASGEDVVDNVVAISHSLRNILDRLERGEGILGELTMETETGERARASLLATLDSVEGIAAKIESGDGTLGRLINDRSLAASLEESAARFDRVLERFESGEGALPALLSDPATREQVRQTLDNLDTASRELAALAADLRDGEGLLPTLVNDPEYGREVAAELREMIHNLNLISEKLNEGDGTAARLINDPQVYEAINDVLVGIEESRLLRWLIRNRQKAGIEKRYEERQEKPQEEP